MEPCGSCRATQGCQDDLSPSAGTDTCSDSLLQMLTEGDVALEWALSFASASSAKRDCLWCGVAGPESGSPSEDAAPCFLSMIFPLEIGAPDPFPLLKSWQPLKFLKQSKQTDTQIHNTKVDLI